MQVAQRKKICPSCIKSIPMDMLLCDCGKDLRGDSYSIVSDGLQFGIYFNGSIVIHGLVSKRAQEMAQILNNISKA